MGIVAQAAVQEDQKRYDSLEAALEVAIDKCTARGSFTFGQLVEETRREFGGAGLREIYFLLVQHCANHLRSVFVEDTQNRLTLTDGRFAQSTRETLPRALASFDAFLVTLIGCLDFHVAQELPFEEALESDTGFRGAEQVILVAELLNSGFLILVDIPGELPHYLLDGSFDWTGRFKLFPRARTEWLVREKHSPQRREADEDDDEEDDSPARWSVENPPSTKSWEGVDFDGLNMLLQKYADAAANRQALADQKRAEKRAAKAASQSVQNAAPSAPDPVTPTSEVRAPAPLSMVEAVASSSLEAFDVLSNSPTRRSEFAHVDSFLAKLLTVISEGRSFTAPDWHALAKIVAEATDTPLDIVWKSLDPASGHAKIFVVGVKGQESILRVNPALSWEQLIRYPRTRAACEKFQGADPGSSDH
ncbi:hypothetical protein [Sulfuritalea hydrogenivorans]|uniref:hypothetical protein n=1 Tax=Sulfuritalea hydrogenivorans TaxID=748811 RepID=UPI0014949AFE|nr:hypothetical protein [Sulfuritalea hydrogenivorans]